MTINHFFLRVSHSKSAALINFYTAALKPLGYKVLLQPSPELCGFGSNYPHFWLKALDPAQTPVSTHTAFDAPSQSWLFGRSVSDFVLM